MSLTTEMPPSIQQFRKNIADDPAKIIKKIFNVTAWPKQCEIVSSVFTHKRTAVRGCVASTKSYGAAMSAILWLLAYPKDGRVFHLAPSFRQVSTNVWGYIKQLNQKASENGRPIGARMFSEPRMEFGDGWLYQGFNTRDETMVHGIHGPNDLILLDDGHAIPIELINELENAFAGGNTRALMLFNPVLNSGPTYTCATEKDADGSLLWNNIVISFKDLEKAYADGYDMTGALQRDTADTWRTKYGAKSSFYVSKVEGEYPDQAADSLIPLSWIELAIKREVPSGGKKIYGVDCAYTGQDSSVIAELEGLRVNTLHEFNGIDPVELADKLDPFLMNKDSIAYVDAIGLGAGTFAREKQRERNVVSFVASEKAIGTHESKPAEDHFQNLRAQAGWKLREALDPKNPNAISLPNDLDLIAQCSAMTYKINPVSGKLQLISKDEIRSKYSWSPDKFDAVMMAVFGMSGVGRIPTWAEWI